MGNKTLETYLAVKYPLSLEVLRQIIEAIPANVFFKDLDCKYRMTSHICEQLNAGGEGRTIFGKTDLEIQPDPKLGRFYFEDDKKIIKTRTGSHYVSKMVFGGVDYYYEITKEPVFDPERKLMGIVGLVTDISELKRLQEKLHILSVTDPLTGVYNRTYFQQRMAELSGAGFSSLSVIMSDTNCLKFFNDGFGHKIGDELLIKTAALLKDGIGSEGEVMRVGGDEFVVFCWNCPELRCRELIRAIKAAEKNYTVLGCPISNSYGYATVSGTGAALGSGLAEAERMMYREKRLAKAAYLKALQEFAGQKSAEF